MFWSRPGAEIFVVIVVDVDMHAAAARDPILPTQRIRKVKISMVGIYKVNVKPQGLVMAHVSHFFSEREPWALKQSTRFAVLSFLKLHLRQLCTCLWPPRRALCSFSTHSVHFLDCSVRSYGTFRTALQPEQIEAVQTRATTHAARLKGTLSNLPAVELSTNNSFGAPPHIFSDPVPLASF